MFSDSTGRFRSAIVLILGAIFTTLVLIPYTTNGLWFDDALNSQVWAMLNRFDVSLWDFSMRICRIWLSAGRLLLGWIWVYGFFYVLKEPLAIRLAGTFLLLVNIGAVCFLLKRTRMPWPTIGLFGLLLFSLFQIRYTDDPIAAYASLFPLLVLMLTASLVLLLQWTENKSRRALAAASIVAVVSMLIYEINVLYFAVASIVVFVTDRQQRYRNLAVVLAPLALFGVAAVFVKLGATASYDGSVLGRLDLIAPTYMKQWSATFPGSFYFFRLSSALSPGALLDLTFRSWIAVTIAVVAFLLTALLLRGVTATRQKPGNRYYPGVLLVASWLFFFPPLLIGISSKYQNYLVFGEAHVPIYYQYFGLALLLAFAVARLTQSAVLTVRRMTHWLLPPTLAVLVACTWTGNMQQKAYFDFIVSEPRESLATAIRLGLLDHVRDGDALTFVDLPHFINGNLIFHLSGKNLAIANDPIVSNFYVTPPRPDARQFTLRRDTSENRAWKLTANP